MSSWARVGATCSFIGVPAGYTFDMRYGEIYPSVGATYTVREVFKDRGGQVLIRLAEIRNPTVLTEEGLAERAYQVETFRPLITKTQEEDVALFKSLVTGASMGVEA